MKWWQKVLLNALVFLSLAGFMDGLYVHSISTAVIAAFIFSILNMLVKPLLILFSLPLTILTLGLFYFVINGTMILMTAAFVPGFSVAGIGTAIWVALVISLVNTIIGSDRNSYV